MMKLLRLIPFLFLLGCEYDGPYKKYQFGDTSIVVITLADGTRCAIMNGTFTEGFHCDWKDPDED